MGDTNVELVLYQNSSNDGSDDYLGDEIEVNFSSDTPQADAEDSSMVDNIVRYNPQQSPIATITEKSNSVPPPDSEQEDFDVPP